jgi:hypothetical protein
MILFNYFKMEDKFSAFSELHQTEELGPVLAIIPACKEAELLAQIMNKQVTAFLYYFLKDAALTKKFLRELLCETCHATLVAEIQDYNWDLDTQTITTPHKKKQDQDTKVIETAIQYKQAFDLRGLGMLEPSPMGTYIMYPYRESFLPKGHLLASFPPRGHLLAIPTRSPNTTEL